MTEKILKKYDIFCNCGDIIYAHNKEEAIKQFYEIHNFPIPNTKDDYRREDYAEEFKIKELP